MPKYIPNENDLYKIKPCIVCGTDVTDDSETCSHECYCQWQEFKKDCKWMTLQDIKDG